MSRWFDNLEIPGRPLHKFSYKGIDFGMKTDQNTGDELSPPKERNVLI